MPWRELLDILIALIQLVVVPALAFGVRIMHELHRELRAINGRLVSLEQWRQDHVIESERRFQDWITLTKPHGPR